MSKHAIKVLEDGTRIYSNYYRYKPVADKDRKYAKRKPEDPRAVRWYGVWLLPLDLLDDTDRHIPETRPDTDAYDHMGQGPNCQCAVCRRPEASRWQTKWWRERGVRL